MTRSARTAYRRSGLGRLSAAMLARCVGITSAADSIVRRVTQSNGTCRPGADGQRQDQIGSPGLHARRLESLDMNLLALRGKPTVDD